MQMYLIYIFELSEFVSFYLGLECLILTQMPSPDGRENPFVFSLKNKRFEMTAGNCSKLL
jgi:hypothetical protein